MTPLVVYINLIGLVFLFVGFFVLFKQGGRARLLLYTSLPSVWLGFVLCFYTEVGTYRDLDLAFAILRNAALIVFPPFSFTSVFFTRCGSSCLNVNAGAQLCSMHRSVLLALRVSFSCGVC